MPITQKIEIALSKRKMILGLLGCIGFIAICSWFIADEYTERTEYYFASWYRTIIGSIGILFFGIMAFYLVKKLADTKPGMVMDEQGIFVNSSAFAPVQIPWKDMIGISEMQVKKTRFIVLHVKNPQDYINQQSSWIKRGMMKANYAQFQSPIHISSTSLKISYEKLWELLNEGISNHQV